MEEQEERELLLSWEIILEQIEKIRVSLSKKTDLEILNIAIKKGHKLNKVTEHFPAYDVALKIKTNNWKPTPKQRQAIINVTAFYIGKYEVLNHNYKTLDEELYDHSEWEVENVWRAK